MAAALGASMWGRGVASGSESPRAVSSTSILKHPTSIYAGRPTISSTSNARFVSGMTRTYSRATKQRRLDQHTQTLPPEAKSWVNYAPLSMTIDSGLEDNHLP